MEKVKQGFAIFEEKIYKSAKRSILLHKPLWAGLGSTTVFFSTVTVTLGTWNRIPVPWYFFYKVLGLILEPLIVFL